MPDTDPMAEALASLAGPPPTLPRRIRPAERVSTALSPSVEVSPTSAQPYRTKKGAIKFQPDVDWSLSRLNEVQSLYKQRQGRDLPVAVRGQGSIHDRWGLDHRNSADISLNPSTPEGQALMSQLQAQNIPFLAFDRAISGVATGPHIHIGRPSHRVGQGEQFTSPAQTSSEDPMSEALTSLGATGSTPSSPAQVMRRPATSDDAAWHFGITPQEAMRLSPRAVQVLEDAVTEDQRKKDLGQTIAPPPLRYQNAMRAKAGLKPLQFNVATDENAPSPYYKPEPGTLPVNASSAFTRRFNAPPQTIEQRLADTAANADDAGERSRIREEVIAERAARQQGPMTQARAALAMADQGQGPTAVEDEVTNRLAVVKAQRAELQRVQSQFTAADKAEIEDFVSHLKGAGAKYAGIRTGARTIGSGVLYKLAGLSEVPTLGHGPNPLGDWLRQKALAGEISVAEVKKELPPSLQRDVADFLTQAGLGVAEIAATPGGPITKFAALAGTEALGRGLPASEVARQTVVGGGVGALFKGAENLAPPVEAGVRERLAAAARQAGTVGAGTAGIELAAGAPPLQAAQAAMSNAVFAGGPTVLGATRGARTGPASLPEEVSQRYYHRDWGEVVKAADQVGAKPGRTRVYEAANPDQFHYPRTTDLAGRGNNLMVPIKAVPETPADPMAGALSDVKIHRAEEPYAGPPEFRGMTEGDLYDLATRRPPKGTPRQKRLDLIRSQAAAVAEIDRRQNEGQPREIAPPDSGVSAGESDVPSFRDYVENRPEGGLKFDTLEPGSADFNRLAGEYVDRYGASPRATRPQEPAASRRPSREIASQNVLRETKAVSVAKPAEKLKATTFPESAQSVGRETSSVKPGEPHPVTGRKFSSSQVNLPPAEARLQEQAASAIPDSELAADGREEVPHITVKYGLHTDNADELRPLLADEPPVKVKLGKVSIFPAKKGAAYDVVKMDVDSPDLHRLNAKISKALPVTDTHPEYRPHVTLAYVRAGLGGKYEGQTNALTGKEITLDKVLFSSKSGKEINIPLKGKEVSKQTASALPWEKLPQIEPRTIGRVSQAVTERGSEINTRYAVVDLDTLITSHDSALRPNPSFPPELQPRERDRVASAVQISRIASNLRPEFLGDSPKASEGAPIVGPDGIVESGNGRVLALRQAFESNNKGAVAYRRYLVDGAKGFGLDPAAIRGAKMPVLVRMRETAVDRSQFVKEANEQSVASMSPVEQARSDAKSLKGDLLDLFQPAETGEIATSRNMNFVRAFMKDVIGPNELNRYVMANGQISQEGIGRIRNAIFTRAYGDSPEGLTALEKLAESPDSNVRNIVTAMLRNTPRFASLKEGIDQGLRYPLDVAPDVAAAVSKISSLRESGTPVVDYLRQGGLYGEELTPLQKRLLQVFDENKRGANTISTILENYAKGAEAAGNPRQAGMFANEVPSKADLLEAAIQEAVYGQGVQTGLFTTEPHQGLPRESSPGKNLAKANPREPVRSPERLADTSATAGEAEGRSLGRFDSAIDRLKGQEELARQRLAERAIEQKKRIEQKGSEAGSSSIPEDLADYVIIGASKLAQRSLNAAQFVDELVKEFGESIRKHARAIFKFSQKMVAETQKEVRAERLSKEIADRLFSENVPKDLQRAALRIAAQFRTSTDTQGKFLSGFKSRVGEMAKSYGAAGGELTNRVHLGDIARGHEMEAGNEYLSKIQDVYAAIKNDFERQRISDSVIKALEDRANAERHLDTPDKKAVYENTVEMLDSFRAKLKALGYETRDDYFTHIRDVDILDQIISDAKDPKDTSLNELVAARSRFLQPRVDANIEIKKDLPRVLHAYLKSVSKEIAYSDAVGYYYDHFLDDIPIGLRKNGMDRAIRLMQNSLKPEQGRGRFFRTVGQLRSQQYRNFLAYNLKAAAQNFTQVDFARMRWTKEATKLTGKVWRDRKVITGPLADAIDIASTKETPLMRFLEQFKGDQPSGTRGRFAETFNKYDPFQRSEGRNWAMTELGSIINSVVKRPEYREMKASKGSVEAINELLKRQDVFDNAVREAATTAAETQVAANPAMRAEFYDAPLHRIIGMFTGFKVRQLQVLGEALGKQTGVDGARAQAILRRGLSGDAQPVEVLREIEAQRRAMETMLSRAIKFREDIGIPHTALREMLKHLRVQEDQLNGIIKRLEPLSGGRPRAILLTAKYFAKVGTISVFFNLFWDAVYSGIAGPEKNEDGDERASKALQRAFWDILPTPFYGADPSKFLVSPVAPNFERSAPYGHITRRGLARDVVSYGASVIPFAGVVDRAANRKLSGALVDLVAPKKEKERKIKF